MIEKSFEIKRNGRIDIDFLFTTRRRSSAGVALPLFGGHQQDVTPDAEQFEWHIWILFPDGIGYACMLTTELCL